MVQDTRPHDKNGMNTRAKAIAIAGTVGVPAKYGGFETVAENLVAHHERHGLQAALAVYCSAKHYPDRQSTYLSARLHYVPLDANGAQSILYDFLSLIDAVRRGTDHVLLLGVSGALILPLLRLISPMRIVTNIDGIEWKRDKWNPLARWILRLSEKAAVRFSHAIIADNVAIGDYVERTYGKPCTVIAYGGDHALAAAAETDGLPELPPKYALSVCRIEPENNIAMILEAWQELEVPLVIVGNWDKSEYGRELRARYGGIDHLHLLDPIYEPGRLRGLRERASCYVHGHSAGGTNPSLVEIMHFGIPVLAHGCSFNRYTTENMAKYFVNSAELAAVAREILAANPQEAGKAMLEIARQKYTWEAVGKAYFKLLGA